MTFTKEEIEYILDSFVNSDIESVMSHFSDEAVLKDSHYPNVKMVGKDAIKEGLEWGFDRMKSLSFSILKFWSIENDVIIKVKTHHVFKGNNKVDIEQIFVFTFNSSRKIISLESYVPYRPNTLPGLIAHIEGLFRKK